jgi:integrase
VSKVSISKHPLLPPPQPVWARSAPDHLVGPRIPAYLTPEEIVRLFAAITSPRDRAIFRLTYHRGLRASELGRPSGSDDTSIESVASNDRAEGGSEFPRVIGAADRPNAQIT